MEPEPVVMTVFVAAAGYTIEECRMNGQNVYKRNLNKLCPRDSIREKKI